MDNVIHPVYIVAVANWSETSFVAAEKAVFRDQKNFFFLKVCCELMQGRKRAKYAGKWSRHDPK